MGEMYREESDRKYKARLHNLYPKFPKYVKDYFVALTAQGITPRTMLSYAYDLMTFFRFLLFHLPELAGKEISDITMEHLNSLSMQDIENYLYWLKQPNLRPDDRSATDCSLARKYSSLRSFIKYFRVHGALAEDVTENLPAPKFESKKFVYLTPDEIAILLDGIENHASTLESKQAINYQLKVVDRDLAIVTLLLGTGLRISELIGINKDDVNFRENSIHIIRKGNKDDYVYFSQEVEDALRDYIDGQRAYMLSHMDEKSKPTALFLSIQKSRISVQAVEDLVSKYAKIYVPWKTITPHKLRHSFASAVYNDETTGGDIYLIQELLGHKSIQSSTIYAHQNTERKRAVSRQLQLRNKDI